MRNPCRIAGVWSLCLLVALSLSGCSELDLGVEPEGPVWGQGEFSEPGPAGPSPGGGDGVGREPRLPEAPGRDVGEYHIGPDDELEVSIYALEKPGEMKTLARTVSVRGRITLPWVGAVTVRDLAVQEAERRIAESYAGRFLRSPQVTVTVIERRSAVVVVSGAVGEPGVYPLRHDRASILGMLSAAGGVTEKAGRHVVLLRRGPATPDGGAGDGDRPGDGSARDRTVRISLKELMQGGNPGVNRTLSDGDILSVPRAAPPRVSVLGYVRRAGAYEIPRDTRLTALDAVAQAGGLTGMARAENCCLVRRDDGGQKTVRVNLSDIANGKTPPLYMKPGDVLVVGTSATARLSEALRPAARVSANATVSPQ